MTTFIHSADWQLGKPFARIADDEQRGRVQRERLEAVRRIGEVARDRKASFVVVAGDLFDSATPKDATISHALAAIGSIGVPVYAIPGNHDHGGPNSLWERSFFLRQQEAVAPNFHMLLKRQPVELDDALLLPCPLLRRHEPDDPTTWLRRFEPASGDQRPRIVIAHGSTRSFGGTALGNSVDGEEAGQANAIDLDRLAMGQFDYIALGDWHGFVKVGEKAWYSGAHEIDRFPKADQLPGHVAAVTVSRGGIPGVEGVPTGKFRWLTNEVALGEDGPELLERVLREATGPRYDDCLVELVLTGSVSLVDRSRLDTLLADWRAGLVRFDLEDRVTLAPTEEEVRSLTNRHDPIISRVAGELFSRIDAGGDEAAVARGAIRLLHGLCRNADGASPANPPQGATP
ncbi:MAG: DNA repair exonuclease [Planctomycetota bacterium]|nr:MAG: DNA repair exonuclease [Planctomycetota bacterium]